jgi:hypothetical protein
MSLNLLVSQAKPNPPGKEVPATQLSKQEQLLGEWVDVENIGDESITFSRIQLHHSLFDEDCRAFSETECYWTVSGLGLLKPGQVLRVHSGGQQVRQMMFSTDHFGADWHGYGLREDFVLNNRCGDRIVVTWQNVEGEEFRDEAFYEPNPPVGSVLKRSGSQLIAEDDLVHG